MVSIRSFRISALWFRGHALFLELFDGVRSFLEIAGPHTLEHVRCLGELDVVIGHDFDPIAPRIAEIEPLVNTLEAKLFQSSAHRFPVIDDKAEVTLVVGPLGLAEAQLNKLVTHIDESVVVAFPTELKIKDRAIEFQRLVQVAYL